MVKFKELGFEEFKEYSQTFFDNLIDTNKTYNYFVDWDKVRKNVKKYLKQIALLNSLVRVPAEEREPYLKSLITESPKILEVISLLIAERLKDGKLNILDLNKLDVFSIDFTPNNITDEKIEIIVTFCRETGVLDLFNEIKDIYDYLFGVEVGLDSNARKNRSGDIFENICFNYLKNIIQTELSDKNFKIKEKDRSVQLIKGKIHDIIIYKDERPILIIECNFYNTSGSKPIAIAESYIELEKIAKEKGLDFLWVTDSSAWLEMRDKIIECMEKMSWILNFKMLNLIPKVLEDIEKRDIIEEV